MAYQNVGTPRFYIDLYEYMNSIGNIKEVKSNEPRLELSGNPFGLHPETPCTWKYTALNEAGNDVATGSVKFIMNRAVGRKLTSKINYHALIGHNLASCQKINNEDIQAGSGVDLENLHFRPNMAMAQVGGTYLGLHGAPSVPLVNCEQSLQIWSAGETLYGFEEEFGDVPRLEEGETLDDIEDKAEGDTYILGTNAWQWNGEEWIDLGEVAQGGGNSGYFHALNDGFSIRESHGTNDDDVYRDYLQFTVGMDGGGDYLNANAEFNLNCLSVGTFYDMPVSPDLDLSMTIEFDGYDTTTTLGGSTLTNVRYTGAPWWVIGENNREPWFVGSGTGVSKRNGRRVWSMKFSYLSEKDIFSSNYMSSTYLESGSGSGYDDDDVVKDGDIIKEFENILDSDDSFVAQVLNKVGNGQRFIFQPDNTNFNPDQFAICQLDQDSLQIKQVAFNTYSISLNIREVW